MLYLLSVCFNCFQDYHETHKKGCQKSIFSSQIKNYPLLLALHCIQHANTQMAQANTQMTYADTQMAQANIHEHG
jgi:hypothetical protein